jgi:hypothetical protein
MPKDMPLIGTTFTLNLVLLLSPYQWLPAVLFGLFEVLSAMAVFTAGLSRPVLVSTCRVDNSLFEIRRLMSGPSAVREQYKIHIALKLLA